MWRVFNTVLRTYAEVNSLINRFKNEVGDVYAMIELTGEWDVLSWDEIENRRDEVKRRNYSNGLT